MKFLQLRWVFILILGVGLTLTGCGEEETVDEPTETEETEVVEAEDTETEAADEVTLEPAPEGTFAFTVQEVLITSFPEQTGYDVTMVACPEEVDSATSDPFECDVMTEDFTTTVDVFPNPDEETFDWLTKGLNLGAIEEAIEAQMSDADMPGIADCGLEADPNPYREYEVDSTFDCIFTSEDGEETTIMITVNDDKGNVTLSTK